jgi:hypothetical protein
MRFCAYFKTTCLLVELLEDRSLLSFIAAPTYATGSYPDCVAAGDFDNNGKSDLAVVSYIPAGTVSILSGNGDGIFQTSHSYAAGSYPTSVAGGDFNGDGKLDLIIGYYNFTSTNVTTLLGNGDGTFQAPVDYAADIGPVGVAVGDLNGDGAPDLVAANVSTSDISVLLNLHDWGGPGVAPMPRGGAESHSAKQELMAEPADSGWDPGRQTEAFFQLPPTHEDALQSGELVISLRTRVYGSDEADAFRSQVGWGWDISCPRMMGPLILECPS